MNPFTGRAVYTQGRPITIQAWVDFYQRVCEAYPKAERIYLAQYNLACSLPS